MENNTLSDAEIVEKFPIRVRRITYPGGKTRFIGQIKQRRLLFFEEWATCTKEQYTYERAYSAAFGVAYDRYKKKHRKEEVVHG